MISPHKRDIHVHIRLWPPATNPGPHPRRPRYDGASRDSGLYNDPHVTALRESPIQQLWRQHMLAELARQHGDYDEGFFIVITPELNHWVHRAPASRTDRWT